jgi:hypothetical protein
MSGMPNMVIREAVHQVSQALHNTRYAIIGGIACILLGSTRATYDIDVIIPNGERNNATHALSQSASFGMEARGNRTWFSASNRNHYNVDIMEPRQIYQTFDFARDTVILNGVRVLRPAALLNYKSLSWSAMDRPSQKKRNDAVDIIFLTRYMAQNGQTVSQMDVPFANADFLTDFVATYPESSRYFTQIGLLSVA